jgi:glycosyltransferase involved in cell wall biosynthesis
MASFHALHLRVPSTTAADVISALAEGQPYGVEVVGDPYDVFAPGAVRHPLRPFFRWWFARNLRRQCAGACAAAYVTTSVLQRRYPPKPGGFSVGYSDVYLTDEAFVAAPREFRSVPSPGKLILVGTMQQMYKGTDVLIDAMSICIQKGIDLRLVIIGDGKYRATLQERVEKLGLARRVSFLGQLPSGDAIRAQLDKADIFVLPSRQEGLPRAMLEAMARSLPCIGSTVGGIPELLPPEDLVTPGNVQALADKIAEVVTNPSRMTTMSARNLAKAREYHENLLRERRIQFYEYVRDATEAWLKATSR